VRNQTPWATILIARQDEAPGEATVPCADPFLPSLFVRAALLSQFAAMPASRLRGYPLPRGRAAAFNA